MYFRRTNPIKTTINRAKLIMKGNLFVHSAWPTVKFTEIKWDEDPFNDITWCFYLHSLDTVGYLMNAHEVEPDVAYLKKSKEIIESWINSNPSKKEQMSFYAWKDHSVANRVVNMVQFWMHYKDSEVYDEEFEVMLKKSLIQHGDFLVLDSNHTFINNHGIFQDRSLIQLAVIFPEFENASMWYDKAIDRFMKHVEKDVAESGVHLEHSDSYHIVVLRLFRTVDEFLIHYNRKNERLSELIYKMEGYLSYLFKPNDTVPMTGDSDPNSIGNISLKGIKNEKLLYVKTKGKEGIKPKDSVVYKDAGVVIVRNNWEFNNKQLYLRFIAAFHSRVHKHADDLSLLLSIGDTDFFTDSGKYNYQEKTDERKYFRSTMAHNTITVNNASYELNEASIGKSNITKYIDDESFVYMQGEHELYENTKIKRSIMYVKDSEMILIHDEIKSEENQTYSQIFNLGEDVHLIPINNKRCFLESKLNGKIIELRQVDSVEDFKHHKGRKNPIRGWISTKFNEKKPISQIEFTNEAQDFEYRTIINTNIDNGARYFSVNQWEDGIRFRIRYKDDEIRVYEIPNDID